MWCRLCFLFVKTIIASLFSNRPTPTNSPRAGVFFFKCFLVFLVSVGFWWLFGFCWLCDCRLCNIPKNGKRVQNLCWLQVSFVSSCCCCCFAGGGGGSGRGCMPPPPNPPPAWRSLIWNFLWHSLILFGFAFVVVIYCLLYRSSFVDAGGLLLLVFFCYAVRDNACDLVISYYDVEKRST